MASSQSGQLLSSDPNAGRTTQSAPVDRATWDRRPDGTKKGDGYLGVLQRPDGAAVMSEYSIADSENPKLKDAKGNYLDYPTFVPTLTKDEVGTLLSLKPGGTVPQSIKQKAEAHALARIAKGEPVWAQPGEQRNDLYPEFTRARVIDSSAGRAAPVSGALLSTDPNAATPLSASRSSTADAPDDGFWSHYLGEVNPFPALHRANTEAATVIQTALSGHLKEAATRTLDDLAGLAKATGSAQAEPYQKGVEAAGKGDYFTAARHFTDWAVPLFGPRMDVSADLAQQGHYRASAGVAAGVATNLIGPKVIDSVAALRTPAAMRPPSSSPAIAFARARGIPMTAGQATENPVLRGVEQLNERTSILGSVVGQGGRTAQNAGLTRVGNELMTDVHPSPITAEQAGQGIRDAVTGKIRDFRAEQNYAYAHLRALEDAKGGVDVDVAGAKAALDPMYQSLLRESELTPLQGGKARALVAIDRLMKGPDSVPLSVADAALGDFKALSRSALPELRTQGQGVAAKAVAELGAQVDAAAFGAGHSVKLALDTGRAATRAKYAAADVLDTLREEPVQAFNQATYAKDAGIDHLRAIAKLVPGELPKIGRAYLEDLFSTATAEGGFGKTASIATKWQNLGPQTKLLLYRDPALVKNLDNFFTFAKRAGESVNPSGSAFVGTLSAKGVYVVMNPLTGIPIELAQGALAQLLTSPTTVNLLTRGLTTPVRATGPARAIAAEIVKVIGPATTAARSATPLPAAAQEESRTGAPQ